MNTANRDPTITCGDDANMQRTGLQDDVRVVLTAAGFLLRAADHSVEHFAEHAVPANTHHAVMGTNRGFSWRFFTEPTCAADSAAEALPIKAGQVFLQEVIPGLVRLFSHCTKQHQARRSHSSCQTFNTFVSLSLTNHVRADSSQLKQRGDQRVVDLSAFPFAPKRIDEHQESVRAQWT